MTKRQGELLCAFAIQELEWMDSEDVDADGFETPNSQTIELGTPVINEVMLVWVEVELRINF